MRPHHYGITTRWTGNLGTGTSACSGYSRNHVLLGEGKGMSIGGSSDPVYRGDRTRYNHEELLVGARGGGGGHSPSRASSLCPGALGEFRRGMRTGGHFRAPRGLAGMAQCGRNATPRTGRFRRRGWQVNGAALFPPRQRHQGLDGRGATHHLYLDDVAWLLGSQGVGEVVEVFDRLAVG